MAAWVPPKIDYWDTPRPVGGEDYKRIEGNTQWLRECSLLWHEPSSDVVIQSLSEKSVAALNYSILKSFRLVHPGRYRVAFEARRVGAEIIVNVLYARLRVGDQVINLAQRTNWTPFTVDVVLGLYDVLTIEGEGAALYPPAGQAQPLPVYIRNVQVFGAPAAVPAPTVLIS